MSGWHAYPAGAKCAILDSPAETLLVGCWSLTGWRAIRSVEISVQYGAAFVRKALQNEARAPLRSAPFSLNRHKEGKGHERRQPGIGDLSRERTS
jgi:hypothetical protein